MPHLPHEPDVPVQDGISEAPVLEAKTESFLERLVEPQWGHLVPRQREERTKSSLSLLHCSQ